MPVSERTERSRLKASLKKLHALTPADLVREDLQHCKLSFRGGLPYLERTLGLFRGLGHGKLAKVPSAYLKIVADHAERSAAQFDEILRFTGEGLANPQDAQPLDRRGARLLPGTPRRSFDPGHSSARPTTAYDARAVVRGRAARDAPVRHVRGRRGSRVPLRTVGFCGPGHHGLAARHRPPIVA